MPFRLTSPIRQPVCCLPIPVAEPLWADFSLDAALQSPLRAIVILTSSCWAKSHIWGLVAALASKTNDSLLPTENYMLG